MSAYPQKFDSLKEWAVRTDEGLYSPIFKSRLAALIFAAYINKMDIWAQVYFADERQHELAGEIQRYLDKEYGEDLEENDTQLPQWVVDDICAFDGIDLHEDPDITTVDDVMRRLDRMAANARHKYHDPMKSIVAHFSAWRHQQISKPAAQCAPEKKAA